MRVLVTGGGGFAGQHLLREVLAQGPEAVAATVLGEPPTWPPDHPFAAVEWLSLDLESPESIRAVVRDFPTDQVYHLAGQASVGRSLELPLETWAVNATGTLHLLIELVATGRPLRFLLASSAEVYGNVPADEQPLHEDRPLQPLTPYGTSKAAAEIAALQMGRVGGVEVVVARSFNHVGPGQDPRFVLPNMALQLHAIAQAGEPGVLHAGNMDVERDFLDVRDAVRGYATIMARGEPGGVYNVSSGRGWSLQAVIERLIEISGADVRLEIDDERVRRVEIPHLVGSPDRLRGLGWAPEYDLDATLKDLLAEAGTRR